MAVIQGVVFDLDDTLFLERDYVRSGFSHIAETVGMQCGLPPSEIAQFLWEGFESGVRCNAFDRLLQAYPGLAERFLVTDLVEAYRDHVPQVRLVPDVEDLIRSARRSGLKLAVLSDGRRPGQQSKLDALGLGELVDLCVFTDKWGREFWKPHLRGFLDVERVWNLSGDELVYIGDNPEKDFVGPNHLGWRTIRLRIPGQLRVDLDPESEGHKAELEVCSVLDLQEVLWDWSRTEKAAA